MTGPRLWVQFAVEHRRSLLALGVCARVVFRSRVRGTALPYGDVIVT